LAVTDVSLLELHGDICVLTIERRIVVAENHINILAALVLDVEVGERGTIWDELYHG
jgi:hypothetical protein